MAIYVFLNFPTFGQVNPTLAIVRELVVRGQEVVYFTGEVFRDAIEAAGARFCPYPVEAPLFHRESRTANPDEDHNRRLALLSFGMLKASRQMVPLLLDAVRAQGPDILVYSDLFLWARIIAHALSLPGVTLRPTYASNASFRRRMLEGTDLAAKQPWPVWIAEEMRHLKDTYHLPFADTTSLFRGDEGLRIVFLPRAFQLDGGAFDERYLFVGPCFNPERDKQYRRGEFPFERMRCRPRVYISLGTIFNSRPEFYRLCFDAFGDQDREVILSLGHQIDPASLVPVPANFITAPHVPQLEILPQTDVFITHGGMNSTMESLYFGVPVIVIPHTNEQTLTAERVETLGLGIALNEAGLTKDTLQKAVARILDEPAFGVRVRSMQKEVREAGGYLKATDALQAYAGNML